MVGEMNGVNVSDNGMIYANYSNGQTKLLGQIASAQFANASGLSKQGDNLYASTLNSGDATIQDITTDGGYMSTGVLEMSNVDLSAQFTEMITTQRGLDQFDVILQRFLHFSGVYAEISLGDVGRGVLEKFHDKDYVVAVGFI